MAERWFRLPETTGGPDGDTIIPDTFGHDVDAQAGNAAHPDGAPTWVVRVRGTPDDLDALASEPQATELPDIPVQALNNMTGQQRDAAGWERGFKVGQ